MSFLFHTLCRKWLLSAEINFLLSPQTLTSLAEVISSVYRGFRLPLCGWYLIRPSATVGKKISGRFSGHEAVVGAVRCADGRDPPHGWDVTWWLTWQQWVFSWNLFNHGSSIAFLVCMPTDQSDEWQGALEDLIQSSTKPVRLVNLHVQDHNSVSSSTLNGIRGKFICTVHFNKQVDSTGFT